MSPLSQPQAPVTLPDDAEARTRLLCRAAAERHQVQFKLHGLPRRCEVHVVGLQRGRVQALMYQLAGSSHSGPLPAWRRVRLDEIEDLEWADDPQASSAQRVEPGKLGSWDVVLAAALDTGPPTT